MKFILSYSAGKDSVMALHKMVAAGHEPAGLLVMVNRELQRSWFHGADLPLLREIARRWISRCCCANPAAGIITQRWRQL